MQRELRYIVLKNRDVQHALTDCEFTILVEICRKVEAHRLDSGRGPMCAVVVEHDWPEYEPTWAAIEARVGAETAVRRMAAGMVPNVQLEGRGDSKRSLLAERPSRSVCYALASPLSMSCTSSML